MSIEEIMKNQFLQWIQQIIDQFLCITIDHFKYIIDFQFNGLDDKITISRAYGSVSIVHKFRCEKCSKDYFSPSRDLCERSIKIYLNSESQTPSQIDVFDAACTGWQRLYDPVYGKFIDKTQNVNNKIIHHWYTKSIPLIKVSMYLLEAVVSATEFEMSNSFFIQCDIVECLKIHPNSVVSLPPIPIFLSLVWYISINPLDTDNIFLTLCKRQ